MDIPQMPQSSQEHPFLTAVRLAAQVGAPHFYADPSFAEPVVILPLRQYQELLGGRGGDAGVIKPESVPVPPPAERVLDQAIEDDGEVSFDHQAMEQKIRQTEQEMIKNPRNIGAWQPIVERSQMPIGGEEGFYMHPVPQRSGFLNR